MKNLHKAEDNSKLREMINESGGKSKDRQEILLLVKLNISSKYCMKIIEERNIRPKKSYTKINKRPQWRANQEKSICPRKWRMGKFEHLKNWICYLERKI